METRKGFRAAITKGIRMTRQERQEIKRARNGASEIEFELFDLTDLATLLVVEVVELHAYIKHDGGIYRFSHVINGRVKYERIYPIEIEVITDLGKG